MGWLRIKYTSGDVRDIELGNFKHIVGIVIRNKNKLIIVNDDDITEMDMEEERR
jgi:hypothetical protein